MFRCGVGAFPRLSLKQGFAKRSEDAYFLLARDHGALLLGGVADGVGAWRGAGIDPAQFSSALMRHAACAASASADPYAILEAAMSDCVQQQVQGSATALIFSAHKSTLRVASIGDSTLLVCRGASLVFSTPRQQLSFSTPFQLGFAPSHHVKFQQPSDAYVGEFELENGDKIIVTTDGLVDNLAVDRVLEVLAASSSSDAAECSQMEALALRLAEEARNNSVDRSRDSPFSLAAKEADVLWHHGGRPDDITVLALAFQSAAASRPARAAGAVTSLPATAPGLADSVPANEAWKEAQLQ